MPGDYRFLLDMRHGADLEPGGYPHRRPRIFAPYDQDTPVIFPLLTILSENHREIPKPCFKRMVGTDRWYRLAYHLSDRAAERTAAAGGTVVPSLLEDPAVHTYRGKWGPYPAIYLDWPEYEYVYVKAPTSVDLMSPDLLPARVAERKAAALVAARAQRKAARDAAQVPWRQLANGVGRRIVVSL